MAHYARRIRVSRREWKAFSPRADEILHLHRKGYCVADIVIYTETKASIVVATIEESKANAK